jgi:flagellar assembly protein FliH
MSSKARRLEAATVQSFDWVETGPGPAAAPTTTAAAQKPAGQKAPAATAAAAPAPQIVEPDPAALEARRAAIERDAFSKGFAQGERAGAEAAGKRGEVMLRRLTETLDELTTLRAQMIHRTEHQMIQLALAVARRIVHREISLDRDLLIAMARVALDRLGESAQVTVRLNPEDFEATAGARASQWTGTNVTVVADSRVSRGGCRVESDLGMMDAGADAQIQEIARALLGDAAEHTGVRVVSS